MLNFLRGNEEIRRHYQFWFYSYPSGYPYPYSAAIMRKQLDGIEKLYPLHKPMVLIGHSMGGCISRLMVTDSGDKIWLGVFGTPPEKTHLSPQARKLVTDSLIFTHRKEVGRVIFISTPHRGSDLASDWIGRIVSAFVRAPSMLVTVGRDALSLTTFHEGDLKIRTIPNSVDTLAPNNRFVKILNLHPDHAGHPLPLDHPATGAGAIRRTRATAWSPTGAAISTARRANSSSPPGMARTRTRRPSPRSLRILKLNVAVENRASR